MKYKKIHPTFKLNGISFGYSDLKEVAYSYIKEGELFEKKIGLFLLDWLDNRSTIAVQTSGSTGTPKTIFLQKEAMINSALATGTYFNLQPGFSALLCLPIDYIAGKMMLVRALVLGLELRVIAPSSNPLIGLEGDFDFCAMVPIQVQNSVEAINKIKTLLVGGTAFPNTLKKQIKDKPTQVYETYGMTETITHVAVKPINACAEEFFCALPKVRFSKDDRDCLEIYAPEVRQETVITNDVVELISETKFKWLGRFDNVINSGGVKLIPEQIEEKFKLVISNRFFVSGIPDAKLGQQMILVVESEFDDVEMLQKLKNLKSVEKYEIPKRVYRLLKFIETKSGKIHRLETLRLIKDHRHMN